MKLLDVILTANRNLLRSKVRTLFTILAIFVGGFTLTLTTALNTGANQYLQRQLGNVSVPGVFEVLPKTNINPLSSGGPSVYDPNKKQSSFLDVLSNGLTQEDVDKVAKVDGVTSAEPFYSSTAEYITRDGQKKYAVTSLQQNIGLNVDLSAGRHLKKDDVNSIVLPESYVTALGFTNQADAIGTKVTLAYKDFRTQKLKELTLTVQGTMRKSFITQDTLIVTLDAAKTIAVAQGQDTKFLTVIATFKDATDATDESVLKTRLQEAGNYTAVSVKERIGTVTTVVGAITAGLNVVGIIALLAASFGIINTLLMSVYEQTQEIGLMKALGMRRGKVFSLFAIEAALVGFWGSVVAVGAATGVSLLIDNWASSNFLKDFEGFTLLVVDPMGAAFVVGLIMLIAFVAGTFPAIKASRLNPIDALRSE